LGEPASQHAERRTVPCASGCAFVTRRAVWAELGGFAPEYFAYHEDTDLSIRTWQRGRTVDYVPDAVVRHHYEFSRTATKFYLIERNRLVVVLTTYQLRSLLVLAPMLVLTELAMVASAVAGRWWSQKVAGWRWLWRHRRWVRARRREVQEARRLPDADIVALMTPRFEPGNLATPPGIGLYNAVSAGYWAIARRLIGRPTRAR
ncbi:MAG TPA: glycosyltransferase, partial [Cryptosporangiaceae bacterium]|nr:glycosyltransferase [Cryptosporangiaceae bacterium]